MNSVLPANPFLAPHLFPHRLSPSRTPTPTPNMNSRKRKADDDGNDGDTRMSASPSSSPHLPTSSLPPVQRNRITKRLRPNLSGRPLTLPRLLETLSQDDLRNLLKSVCDRHPELSSEITNTAPRPGVDAVLGTLNQYEATMRASFPFGGREGSDYAYNRVRQPLEELIEALRDYTPTFLPPNELQPTVSLKFLDGVTNMIHRLPNWENYQHNRHKHEAYEDISRAWASAIKEASKRGGGIQLRIGGWDQKIAKHHQTSGNRLEEAMRELQAGLNWIANEGSSGGAVPTGQQSDQQSIRHQLLSGSYGDAVRVGPW